MTIIGKGQASDNQLFWVADNVIANDFPKVSSALRDPDGLLAIGGDLSADRLLKAYRRGIFPWYSEGQPILWWSPDPRCVLEPENIKISRSLCKTLKKGIYQTSFNRAFEKVIRACAEPRDNTPGTWITAEMLQAYIELHEAGHAVSVECWHGAELVGGLYGVAIGKVFFGESMFSCRTDASKVALVYLAETVYALGFRLIDCQVYSKHLQSLGAVPMQRELFISILNNYCNSAASLDWPGESIRA
jgi:leucyl/phenylalanyl-tRNA---protein transferase